MKNITLAIVDDHTIVRMGLKALFDSEDGFEVVGEADNGQDAITLVTTRKPDLVIMDLMMPGIDGVSATEAILRRMPETRILILTTLSSSDEISRALALGARGAILKSASDVKLLEAVRRIADGEHVLSDDVQKLLEEDPPVHQLTERQKKVLDAVTRGFTNRDIASMLGIRVDSVQGHVKKVLEKMGASNRAEAIAIALRKHLLKI